jgi:hypothetical protein
MKYAEQFMHPEVRGTLSVTIRGSDFGEAELREMIAAAKCTIIAWAYEFVHDPERREIDCDLEWRPSEISMPPVIEALRSNPAVTRVSWRPQGTAGDPNSQSQPSGRRPSLGQRASMDQQTH